MSLFYLTCLGHLLVGLIVERPINRQERIGGTSGQREELWEKNSRWEIHQPDIEEVVHMVLRRGSQSCCPTLINVNGLI